MRSLEVNRDVLMKTTEPVAQAVHLGPKRTDIAFMVFMVGLLIFVSWLTTINYQEGMKTEVAKRNGEAWVEWLSQTGAQRFEPGFANPACAGAKAAPAPTTASATDPAQPGEKSPAQGTWGACFAYIQSQTPLKDLVNTFFDKPPHFISQCDKGDRSTTGAIVLENLVPTPAGSAIPVVVKPLSETDVITGKIQIRVTVCDKGGYPIKISEIEF
jgi:hypothetical protein